MTNGALELSHDDFWGPVAAKQAPKQAIIRRIIDEQFSGLVADAPASVALASRGSLPIITYFARTIRDDVHLDIGRQLILVGSDHETHEVRAKLAARPAKLRPPAAPPPAADPGQGSTISMHEIDAARVLPLADLPGRWSFRVLIREWCSEVLETEIGRAPGSFRDAAADALIAERRRKNPPPPPAIRPPHPPRKVGVSASYGARYPRYGAKAEAPEPPAEPGVILDIERAVVSNERCIARGSFRLPALPREIVGTRPYAPRPGELERRRPPVGDDEAKAVMSLSLVMTGTTDPGPHIVTLQLPAYELDGPDDAPIAIGRFELDLFELPDMPRQATTYFIHAAHGPHVLGPLPVAIVKPEMIR